MDSAELVVVEYLKTLFLLNLFTFLEKKSLRTAVHLYLVMLLRCHVQICVTEFCIRNPYFYQDDILNIVLVKIAVLMLC